MARERRLVFLIRRHLTYANLDAVLAVLDSVSRRVRMTAGRFASSARQAGPGL